MLSLEFYNPDFVRRVFDEMSETYGLVNLISSLGFSKRWRRQCVRCLKIPYGAVVLDLMAGMGELTPDIASFIGSEGHLTSLDISTKMCAVARQYEGRKLGPEVQVIEADVLTCDLPSDCTDVVLSTFGLKTFNIDQLQTLGQQVRRLLKPSGQFAFLEISVPDSPLLKAFYLFYISKVIPIIGRIILGNPDNYRLLGQYTKAFRNCNHVVEMFRKAGLEVETRSFFFGCATAVYGKRIE